MIMSCSGPTEPLSSEKDITSFSLTSLAPVETASISGTDIKVIVPRGTDLSSLVASFTATGVKVEANSIVQTSGSTAVDFSLPVIYRVTAEDGSVKDYTVAVLQSMMISAGNEHSMVLKPDNSLWAFGSNTFGQLGDGTTANRPAPVKIMENVKKMSTGGSHSLILKTDNTLWACGENSSGQLGDGTTLDRQSPVKVMEDVKDISAGGGHSLILKTDNSLWACGFNAWSQLGDGTTTSQETPVKIMEGVSHLRANGATSMILKTDKTLWAWGQYYIVEEKYPSPGWGHMKETIITRPKKIMEDVKTMAWGNEHYVILKTNNSLWAWGENSYGQVGSTADNNSHKNQIDPVEVLQDIREVSAAGLSSLIVKTDNTLWGFGRNNNGQLGDGTTTDRFTPVMIMDNARVVSMGGGDKVYHNLILKKDNSLWTWGSNEKGQLGDGTYTTRPTPVKIME